MRLIWCSVVVIVFCAIYIIWMPWTSDNFLNDKTRVNKMQLCILDQQLPCRWVGNYQYELGSPIFNYVAPLPYYIGGYGYALINNFDLITRILSLLPLVLIGLGIWVYSRNKQWSVKLSTFFFTLTAVFYGLSLFFFGFGVGILWGIGTFILVAVAYERLQEKKIIKNSLWLAIYMAMFMLSVQEAVLILGICVALGVFFAWIVKKIRLFVLMLFSTLLAIGLSSFYIFPMILESDQVKLNVINGEFLPISVRSVPDDEPINKIVVLAGEAQIFGFEQSSASFRFGVDNGDHSIIRLAVPYFPNWEIKANGVIVNNYFDNNSLGLTTLIFGEGRFIVEGKLYDTPVREMANIVSLASFVVLMFMLFSEMSRIRSGLRYYLKALHS